ncbi:MAG TPA: BLUF domain-containing protein [Methylophilus sp.]|jgi:hypothetical protein|nr:BLUF domain-containing protein [Methylophilus sp.]
MKFVLYTSTLNLDDYDVLVVPEIIRTARIQNSIHQITGVLFFDGFNFTQYFEGEVADVDRLSENIRKDSRHKNIVTILSGHHDTRLYADWMMGYIDTSQPTGVYEQSSPNSDLNMESFQHLVNQYHVE